MGQINFSLVLLLHAAKNHAPTKIKQTNKKALYTVWDKHRKTEQAEKTS